jgi:ABC-type branched-subunit amino acid transport system ATPase component
VGDVLRAEDIAVSFGGVRAVDSVSLTLGEREVLGIVGPNGSGKTTFLNALTGVVDARGSLWIGDRRVRLGRPQDVRAAGTLRLFQAPQIYTELTCGENAMLSSSDTSLGGLVGAWLARPAMWRAEHRRRARAVECLARVGLGGFADVSANLLTYGQRRLLELARALAADPAVLMLDEPSAGLNRFETERLAELCLSLRDDGLSLMVIDHKIDFIDTISDRVAVLELGSLVAVGPPSTIWDDERVRAAYLGIAPEATGA